MRFDVIIGNPPYHLDDNGYGRSAKPLYHKFVQQAKRLKPRLITMVIPARWFTSGKGLDKFRNEMLNDDQIRKIVDYENAAQVFPTVKIKGGVCHFLWERNSRGFCEVTTVSQNNRTTAYRALNEFPVFVRYAEALPILRKVLALKEEPFSNLVNGRTAFGFKSNFKEYQKEPFEGSVKIFVRGDTGYIKPSQIIKNMDWVEKHKVLVAQACEGKTFGSCKVISRPFLGEPGTCCSETYIVIGPFVSKEICAHVMSYMCTKFFRFLVLLKKQTQQASTKVYSFVPMQDFTQPWTDDKLYRKYNLTPEEIAFIESKIKPMSSEHEPSKQPNASMGT